jgi:hypothetical protein
MQLTKLKNLGRGLLALSAVTWLACRDDHGGCDEPGACSNQTPAVGTADPGGAAGAVGAGTRDAAAAGNDPGAGAADAPGNPGVRPAGTQPAPVTALSRKVGDWYKPVLLFDDGWALLRVLGPAVESPITHRQREPSRWTRWRRAGDAYELQSSSGSWQKLNGEGYPALPKDHRFNLPYGTLSVTSSGDSTFINAKWIAFRADSKFTMNAAGRTSYDGQPVPGSIYDDPTLRGTYTVEGYLLTLTYDDGRIEKRGLVSAGGDEWMLWINDTVYCHEEADGDLSCSSK